mgnify:CR=1 FL=1
MKVYAGVNALSMDSGAKVKNCKTTVILTLMQIPVSTVAVLCLGVLYFDIRPSAVIASGRTTVKYHRLNRFMSMGPTTRNWANAANLE